LTLHPHGIAHDLRSQNAFCCASDNGTYRENIIE